MQTLLNPSLVYLALIYSSLSFAGGPLLVLEGTNGHAPVTYLDANITLDVETGDLVTLSNAAANTLVRQALDLWNNVPTSTLTLSLNSASIDIDINENTYKNYIPADSSAPPGPNDALNPLIYDKNGKIIDAH
jgi:hypothetical protein